MHQWAAADDLDDADEARRNMLSPRLSFRSKFTFGGIGIKHNRR
jgi:hypothetical protein